MVVWDLPPDIPEGLCTLKLPRHLLEETREVAQRTGVTRNHIVAEALSCYLALRGTPQGTPSTKGGEQDVK